MNAADVFVLPTLAEGCCNAILEAMACGLPIISSNLPFNWDILNDKNSILIDPNNINQIADAIQRLRDSPKLRSEMSEEALKNEILMSWTQKLKGLAAASLILKTLNDNP